MASVRDGVETLPKISIAWVRCTNVTDRQTDDRRTCTTTLLKRLAYKKNLHRISVIIRIQQ